jgi:hypothetical protein
MTIPNSTFTEILSSTLRDFQNDFADNVTDKNALLTAMKDVGGIKLKTGGESIQQQLAYAENSTFQYYSGYETLDVSASDTLTSANYDWKQAAVNITISGLERRQNSGEAQIIDLVTSRTKVAMMTMANNINVGLYSDGTGSSGKQIGGLQLIVADDPTTGTVGGIDASTQTFWRNVAYDATTDGGAAASASNIIKYMNTVYNQLTRGTDKPNLIVADQNYYNFYQQALQSIQRVNVNEGAVAKMASSGFAALDYLGVPVVLDNDIPTNHMYFLNTNYLEFCVHENANFTPGEMDKPINQDAMVMPILFMGNLTCSNRSLQGVLKD